MEVEDNVEPIFLYGFDASVNTEDIKCNLFIFINY